MSDALADLRYALRSWRRQPGFVAVAVVSLAFGIGLNTAVFSIVNAVFLQSIRGVPAPERVVSIGTRTPFTVYRQLRETSLTLDGLAAWQPVAVDIRFRDSVLRGVVPVVSSGYFSTLGVVPAGGRFFTPSAARTPDPAAEAILDYEFWTKTMNADPGVIGERILVNRVPTTILGIAPRSFHGFGPERPPMWISMGMLPAVRGESARWDDAAQSGWRIFGRLRPGGSVGQVNAELRALAARSPDVFPGGALTGSVGAEGWSGPVSAEKRIEFLLVVVVPLAVAGLILWIGCSNVANLLLARAAARRKEIAIRLANGATRARLIRLLLTESLLLALAGGGLGMLLGLWMLDFVWLTLPDAPRLAIELDLRVLSYTSAVCVGATLFFGLLPALHATRVDVGPLLKGGSAAPHADRRRSARLRRFFLVTQFASSMALLVVAGTFVRAVVATHVGPQSALIDHLALARLETDEPPAGRAAYWGAVREAVRRISGVSSLTLTPAGAAAALLLVPEGTDARLAPARALVQRIDAGFFPTSGLATVAGHANLDGLPQGTPERAVVNERAARQFWGGNDAVGRRFSLGGSAPLTVAGIVRDNETDARVFRLLKDEELADANVLVRSSGPSEPLVAPLRSVLSSIGREPAFVRVTTLRDAATGPLARLTSMAVVIAALVLSLASVGLCGSISFVTGQRTREIAIRIAVGARAPAVLRLVAREGLLVVSIGSALGLALIAIAFRFMSGMIFATWRLEPFTIAGVFALFALATLAACYLPGRRAIRLDPMTVLRGD